MNEVQEGSFRVTMVGADVTWEPVPTNWRSNSSPRCFVCPVCGLEVEVRHGSGQPLCCDGPMRPRASATEPAILAAS